VKIARWKPDDSSNFGDALNEYIWPRVLSPDFNTVAPDGMFYGIGTVLRIDMPRYTPSVIFGAGIGYCGTPDSAGWDIRFVRGPHTAKALGNVPYITDPGILVANLGPWERQSARYDCSFMPRWDSFYPGLIEALETVGIHLIDPRLPVPDVVAEILQSRLLLSEAFHGAVVADTLGVPWISIYSNRGHEYKWYDWCASMNMVWNPIDTEVYSLTWAREYAVPQRSARSIHSRKTTEMLAAIRLLNSDMEHRLGVFA
jgi:succinoglycan biosynthesis protein ExoV